MADPDPPNPASPHHHTPAGFRNNHSDHTSRSLAEVLRWRANAARHGLPPPPREPIPRVAPALEPLRANAVASAAMRPSATWIGHATVWIQAGGFNLLTDPIFSERASPLRFVGPRRHQPPGVALADLPRIDVVLVSHNHYDHLDAPTVRALARQRGGPPLFAVPLGLKAWFAGLGLGEHTVELDWWQSHHLAGPLGTVELMLVPAQHWSARGLNDRMKTLWGGFAVFAPDAQVFFAGDTGYSRDFAEMRQRFAERQTPALGGGFDLALIPIGAYEPRWFMAPQHVNADEAVRIHRDLGAKASLGIHWGTFELTDEALDEPPRALRRARAEQAVHEDTFFTLAIGETRWLPPRAPGKRP
jgi:N-acyl-phosphatidylethanolamine-hydrolysing phospholipase D